MEYASIHREVQIDASPEVVYQVISRPEHLREWWPDEAELNGDAAPGATGQITFGDSSTPEAHLVQLTVVEAEPSRRFSFRWVYDHPEAAALLVTFELSPVSGGTLLRFTEEGFREKGWEVAVLEEAYREHVQGWDHFLPRLASYAAGLMATP